MTKQCGIANYRQVLVGDLGSFLSIEPFDGLLSRPMSIDFKRRSVALVGATLLSLSWY
jgi:hypothetical protein